MLDAKMSTVGRFLLLLCCVLQAAQAEVSGQYRYRSAGCRDVSAVLHFRLHFAGDSFDCSTVTNSNGTVTVNCNSKGGLAANFKCKRGNYQQVPCKSL